MSLNLLSVRARQNHGASTTGDPFWANVSALLYMNGANNSTVFTDETGTPWTAVGAAKLSTAQAKFGVSSQLSIANSIMPIVTPDSAKFQMGVGDFTYEGWYLPSPPTADAGIHYLKGVNTTGGLSFGLTPTTVLIRRNGLTNSIASIPTLSSWTHVAYVRQGANVFAYVNGVKVLTAAAGFNNNDTSQLVIGSNSNIGGSSLYSYAGYSDCIRLTKGVARYTSNFTPPSAPFPNHL